MLYTDDIVSVIQVGAKIHATDNVGNKFLLTATPNDELFANGSRVDVERKGTVEGLVCWDNGDISFKLDKKAIEDIYYALTQISVDREKARMTPVLKHLLEKYPQAVAYVLKDLRCQEKHKGCVIVVPCPLGAAINKKPDRLSGYMLDQDNFTTLNYETVAEWRFKENYLGIAINDFEYAFAEARNKHPE